MEFTMKYFFSLVVFIGAFVVFQTEGNCILCALCKEYLKECKDNVCGSFMGTRKETCMATGSGCEFSPFYTDCKKAACFEEAEPTKTDNSSSL